MTNNSKMPMEGTKYTVYFSRWYALAMFSWLELSNALLWVTFSPISDIASVYFGGSGSTYGSTTNINMLANIFLILYFPGTILAILSMEYLKPRKSLLIAGSLTALGAFVRYWGTLYNDSLGNENTYILVLLGQALSAIAQPMFLNFPPAIASIWFPVDERDISTTIGSMSSPVGNAIGQIIPILIVYKKNQKDDDDNYDVAGMPDLMLVEFILCLLPLTLAYFFFKDAPPTPPSHSTQLKLQGSALIQSLSRQASGAPEGSPIQTMSPILQEEGGGGENSFRSVQFNDSNRSQLNKSGEQTTSPVEHHNVQHTSTREHFHRVVKQLFGNKDYVILFLVFSIGVGFFNSILTLLNQIVQPFGYSNDDAGTFGAVFIVFGLVGAGVMGYLMEKTRKYRELLKGGIGFCCAATLFFLLMLFSDNFWPLTLSFAIMGFFILPLLPVMMENCAECTYPIPEEIPTGLMLAASNILGLGFIFSLQYLLELDRFGPPPLLPSNVLIIGIIVLAAILLYFYKGEYKRLQHEEMNTRLTDMETTSLLHQHDSLYVPPSTITSLDDSANHPSHLVRIGSSDNSNDHRPTFVTTSLWNTTEASTSMDVRQSQTGTAPNTNAVQQTWQQSLVRAATQS